MRLKSKIMILLAVFAFSFVLGQENFNIEQVAHIPNEERLSDIWGYVDEDGTEYAIIGTLTKTEIYSLADPTNPTLVFSVTGASSIWRDIKTLGNYVYVTADQGADGVTIIDMTNAPDNITATMVNPMVDSVEIQACHNLYIDTASQIMFLAGCNTLTGILAFDITTDPLNPTLINEVTTPYSHDVFVRDGLAFSSEIFGGELAIYDINDIMNPVLLGSVQTTNLFTHNAWSSDDNQYIFTTDEVPNGTIDAYDISDPSNPIQIDVFVPQSIVGQGIVPHNTHWQDNYLITSWYDYGVVITDVSNPSSVIETGHFNTGENPNCWGVYPFLPSGLIIASDISNGLFVLEPTYTRASFVTGVITDADTGAPIFDATVDILADLPLGSRSNPKGEYAAGQLLAGTFTVNFNHPEYEQLVTEVSLVQGETVISDVALEKSPVFMQTINVLDASTGEAVEGADVLMQKEGLDIQEVTGSDGLVNGAYVSGEYQIITGKWGYKYGVIDASFLEDGEYTIELERAYQDDFVFDNGWTSAAADENSLWVRVEPIGTFFNDEASNPVEDVDTDLGTTCYVTGNGSGGTGSFDVDDGNSILTSPSMDLTNSPNATLSFSHWFFNDGASSVAPNDTFKIFVSNGTEKELLMQITENTGGWASSPTFTLADFISLNDQVQISFEAADQANTGHLVEAGLDAFQVELSASVSTEEELRNGSEWTLYPNPVNDRIRLSNKKLKSNVAYKIFSIDGKLISSGVTSGNEISIVAPELPGVYFLNISDKTNDGERIKFVKL